MRNKMLRFYLRGLGVGILITACILGLVQDEPEALTDEEVRERAIQLGMVDSNFMVLTEYQKYDETQESYEQEIEPVQTEEKSESAEPEHSESETSEIESRELNETDSTDALQDTERDSESESTTEVESVPETEEPQESESEEETAETDSSTAEESVTDTTATEETATEESESGNRDVVTIEIRPGASSYTVAKDLEAAGLVADAKAFDTFLCDNGYAQSIRVGTFEITMGTSEEEIAKIITGKR